MQRSTYLTDRFFMLMGCCLLLAVAGLIFPPVVLISIVSLPLLLVATLADRFTLPKSRDFVAEITLERTPELGEETRVEIVLKPSRGAHLRPSRIKLVRPRLNTLEFPDTLGAFTSVKGEGTRTLLNRTVARAIRLGFERVEKLRLLARSEGALWHLTWDTPAAAQFRVIPSRREMSEPSYRELTSRQRLLYQGGRQKLRGNAADEFHSIRKYQFPDPIRYIDAKKTARYGQLMTRVYDSFFDQHVIIALDLGRSMKGEIAGSQKLDFYLSACLQLAQDAVRARDRLSFFSFSQKVIFSVRTTRTLAPFTPLFEGREMFRAREEESNFECLLPTVSRITGNRSIFLLFTDVSRPSVQEALARSLPQLCQKHLTVVISVVDEAHSLAHQVEALSEGPLGIYDYSRLLHTYWVSDSLPHFRNQLGRYGGGTLSVSHRDWMSVVHRLYAQLRSSTGI